MTKSFSSVEELQDFLKYDQDFYFSILVDALSNDSDMADKKLDIYLFTAVIENSPAVLDIRCPYDLREHSLTKALEYYESEEDYEKCLKVKKILDKYYKK